MINLCILSDGLWDVLGHKDVAQLIGSYIEGDDEVYELNAGVYLKKSSSMCTTTHT